MANPATAREAAQRMIHGNAPVAQAQRFGKKTNRRRGGPCTLAPRHGARGLIVVKTSVYFQRGRAGVDMGFELDDTSRGRVRASPAIGAFERDNGVELRDLTVGYRGRVALEGVGGHFVPGSLTAVAGPNGAGKSTLLKAVAGVTPIRSGAIRFGAERRLGYLPQRAEIDRGFPIAIGEFIALGAWRRFGALRRPPSGLDGEVAQAAAAVGLADVLARPIAELSVGQFQRVLFARLSLQDAAIVLLDEPFAGVDEATTHDLMAIVLGWRAQGRTVIAVMHDLDTIRAFFPTTLLLAGACVGWGATVGVLTGENLARARKRLAGGAQSRTGAPA